ncbi:hypothetical protein PENTCL1PPCAC_22592, partial [Pristionchus entomophagus]
CRRTLWRLGRNWELSLREDRACRRHWDSWRCRFTISRRLISMRQASTEISSRDGIDTPSPLLFPNRQPLNWRRSRIEKLSKTRIVSSLLLPSLPLSLNGNRQLMQLMGFLHPLEFPLFLHQWAESWRDQAAAIAISRKKRYMMMTFLVRKREESKSFDTMLSFYVLILILNNSHYYSYMVSFRCSHCTYSMLCYQFVLPNTRFCINNTVVANWLVDHARSSFRIPYWNEISWNENE